VKNQKEVVVVCARITTPLYIEDNETGTCSECGCMVQFRPHAPKGRKICMGCASDLIETGAKVEVTPRVMQDLKDYYRKKQH